MSLPDDKAEGLAVLRPDQESVLVSFRDNVTLTCNTPGRKLRNTATSGFRQCVYDPKPVCYDFAIFPQLARLLASYFVLNTFSHRNCLFLF